MVHRFKTQPANLVLLSFCLLLMRLGNIKSRLPLHQHLMLPYESQGYVMQLMLIKLLALLNIEKARIEV